MIASRFTGRRVLLAVCALGAASAAAVPIAARVAPAATTPAPEVIVVIVPAPAPVVIEVMRPRVMPTGAPACGNVTARAMPSCLPGSE